MEEKIKISKKQIRANQHNAKKMLAFINQAKNKNEKIEITDKVYSFLIEISEKGYSKNLIYGNTIIDFIEYSPQLKEIRIAMIKKGFSSKNKVVDSSDHSSDSSSDHSSETVQTIPLTAVQTHFSESYNNRFIGENLIESIKRRTNRQINIVCSKKIIPAVYSNLNSLNQFQTLEVTLTTSEKYQTTDIKAFKKQVDDYFKEKLPKKLKKYTVKHRKSETTYTYENFSYIGVISCNEKGYLHCHCLMMFEGVVSKIAPIKRKKGKNKKKRGTGFNLSNNPIQKCWKYGNAHIIHFLKKDSLPVERIENIAQYFCKNFIEIKELRHMTDEELRGKATNIITGGVDEEAYKNFCSLREQQADGKRNKLFFEENTVKKEDLTVSMEYGQAEKYINGMILRNQEIKFRFIKIDEIYKLQISIIETYDSNFRNYKTSANLLNKDYYRRVQRQRRQPVIVSPQPTTAQQQPITPQPQQTAEQVYYDDYNSDYESYYDDVSALSEEEDVYYLYADEEDMLLYEEMRSGLVSVW